MKNTVIATVPFSFKGESLVPALCIDLDSHTLTSLTNIKHLVAIENNIGVYSYEYEVLESSTVVFSAAENLAAPFLSDMQFDMAAYYQSIEDSNAVQHLKEVAIAALGKEAWNDGLKKVLYQAYEYGIMQQRNKQKVD